MEMKWFDVNGDIDTINKNIFEVLKNTEVYLKKSLKVKNRSIFLNKTTGFLHAIVQVACE